MRVGAQRRLSVQELLLLNCGVGEDSWEPLGLQRDATNRKGKQPWLFIGRTDAEAEATVLWPLMWRANLLEKTLMLRKIEGRRSGRQRMIWLEYTWLNGHKFGQTLGNSEGQGSLVCFSTSLCKKSDFAKSQTGLSNEHKHGSFIPSFLRDLYNVLHTSCINL